MSEFNDGGLAERGGGGLANPGGPNTAGGGGGQANRSGMGLGVNSGSGWARNPYVNSATSGSLGATLAAAQRARAQAAARARAAAVAAGVVAPPTVTPPAPVPGQPPINPATGQPYANFQRPFDYGSWAMGNTGGVHFPGSYPGGDQPPNNIGGFQGTLNDFGGGPTGFNASTQGNEGGISFGGGGDGQYGPEDTGRGFRQFGGPVAPGQQYTVGENGPETLHMAPGSSGMVTPHNPMDRAIGFQRRQFGGPVGMPGKQPSAGMAMPVNPTPAGAGRSATFPPQGGTAQPYLNNPYLTHYTDQAGLDAGIAAWNAAGGTNTAPPPGMPAHAPGVGEPGFVPGPPRGPDPTLGQQPLGGMNPNLMRDQFQLMRQQKKSQPMVPPPPPAPPTNPAMAAWQQQRPEWGGDPTQKMAFKDSIHAWKDQRPASQFGGGFGLSGLGQSGVLNQLRGRARLA